MWFVIGIIWTYGSFLFPVVAGVYGLPFLPVYFGSFIVLLVTVRLRLGDDRSMVDMTEKHNKNFMAYGLPVMIPVIFYGFGWLLGGFS